MRRASLSPMVSVGSCSGQEPLIVVEESGGMEEEGAVGPALTSGRQSLDIDSPQNPYLLSPWRDTRKHSLPTPSCTSGITASQVRRLSERGGEGSGPTPREAAFLATLSSAPAPAPGGRRHSVVTISRVPPALFGRGRRESVAALPPRAPAYGPPATDRRGSSHNLQLDIMDDIVTARKVRMKLWNAAGERVCEVQPLDEVEGGGEAGAGGGGAARPQRYTRASRRHSEQPPGPPPPIPRRRASELPPHQGIVCTDTDLISILSNLTSSAAEIDRCGVRPPDKPSTSTDTSVETKRNVLKNSRSNSFDVSVLETNRGIVTENDDSANNSPSSWFIKRHQTLAGKKNEPDVKLVPPVPPRRIPPRVVWDAPSGSVVDAQALGSAIEVFLRQTGDQVVSQPQAQGQGGPQLQQQQQQQMWTAPKTEEEDPTGTCDTSLCSTLKDLFVK